MRHTVPVSAAMILSVTLPLRGQTLSLQMGAAFVDGFRMPDIGVRVSPRGGTVGVEASVDAYPLILLVPAFAGTADLSFAPRVRVGPMTMVGRAGGTLFTAVGAGGAGTVSAGFQGGFGIIVAGDSRTTVRLDYTYRRIHGALDSPVLSSVTFGFIVRH